MQSLRVMFGCVRNQIHHTCFGFVFLPIDVESVPTRVFRDRVEQRFDVSVQVKRVVSNEATELIIDTGGLRNVDSHLAAFLVVPPRFALFRSSLTENRAREWDRLKMSASSGHQCLPRIRDTSISKHSNHSLDRGRVLPTHQQQTPLLLGA